MPAFKDLAGLRFGRWFVVARVENSKPALWHLKCDCGAEAVRPGGNLSGGVSRSCGCIQKDANRSRATDPTEAFWAKVNKDGATVMADLGQCWEWTASRNEWGYGAVLKKKYGQASAHRYSWVLHNGPIPDGLWVLHRCDNPGCVRPDHLFLGTVADNNADKTNKGRQARKETHGDYFARGTSHGAETHPEKFRGEGNHFAKLTEAQVIEIRARVGKRNGAALAREFGVTRGAVNAIKRGRAWNCLPPDSAVVPDGDLVNGLDLNDLSVLEPEPAHLAVGIGLPFEDEPAAGRRPS